MPETEHYREKELTKFFEYMAAGRPIVASGLPAIREILRDGENAVLVPAGDPTAIAGAIQRLIDDRQLAERLATTAHREASSYTWGRRAEQLEALLARVIAA